MWLNKSCISAEYDSKHMLGLQTIPCLWVFQWHSRLTQGFCMHPAEAIILILEISYYNINFLLCQIKMVGSSTISQTKFLFFGNWKNSRA